MVVRTEIAPCNGEPSVFNEVILSTISKEFLTVSNEQLITYMFIYSWQDMPENCCVVVLLVYFQKKIKYPVGIIWYDHTPTYI